MRRTALFLFFYGKAIMKNIGGQAVIEGVMMKSRWGWTVAVRSKGGGILMKSEPITPPGAFLKLPVVRGAIALFHALVLGIRALEFSATSASQEEGEKPISKSAMGLTIAFSMALGVVLFILLPLYATKLIGVVAHRVEGSTIVFNLVDGAVRMAVFLLYVWAVGLWAEMRRVYEYHGAEHKVIHAFEEGKELIPENIRPYSPHHPRCGTSFLLIVMLMSIALFSFIPNVWPLYMKFLSRLVLIPLIAGLSYEMLRLSARMKDNPLVRVMIMPGLALQRLTTREPDDSQIEVAVKALEGVLAYEQGGQSGEGHAR